MMNDDDKIQKAINAGALAKSWLDDPAIIKVFATVRRNAIETMLIPANVDHLARLQAKVLAIDEIIQELHSLVTNGVIARRDLERLN